jgi:hypothetical protein
VTAYTAELNWTAGGTEAEWTIDANGTLITGVTTNPYTLTGLTAGTEYTVKVKANCTDEDASDWSTTVSFTTLPTCLAPTALTVTEGSITTTSAEISWTANTGESTWTIDVNGTVIANVTENPYTLTGLNPGTSYTVKVKANCSDEDASAWSNTVSFLTNYGIPFIEPFANSSIPANWTRYSGLLEGVMGGTVTLSSISSYWNFGSSNGVFDSHARLNIYGGSCKYWLVTPSLMMEDNVRLTFDLALTAYSGTLAAVTAGNQGDDKFVVLITTDNGTTWEILRQYDNAGSEYVYDNIATEGEFVAIDLSSYTGQNIAVAFYGESTASGGDNNLHIDNVRIDYTPSCEAPTAVQVSDITATTASVSWTENNATAATAWTIEVNGTEITNITENPYTLTGLTPETEYTVKVKANCTSTDASAYSNPANFTTIPSCLAPTNLTYTDLQSTSVTLSWTANNGETQWIVVLNDEEILVEENPVTISTLTAETDYTVNVRSLCSAEDTSHNSNTVAFYTGICVPAPTSVDNNGITNVTFGQTEVVNNTTHPTSQPYYGNYTDQIGDGAAGTAVTVDVTYATGYTYGTVIWVNWNNDVQFTDDEVVYAGTAPSTNPTTLSCTFTIPANIPVGTYRMRIGGADSQFDNAITNGSNYNPCLNTYYTIYEDYTLSVTEAPGCLAPTLNPAENVTATSATISWTANSGETEWTLEVNGEEIANVTENPYTLDDLDPATVYTVRIMANCSADDESDWSSTMDFATACVPLTSLEEDFESYTSGLPTCWDKVGAGTVAVQTSQPNSGSKSLRFSGVSGGNIVALPEFESYDGLTLSFYTKPESNTYASCGSFAVGYITDIADATTFTAIETYNYNDADFSAYAEKVIDLSTVPANARLAFNHIASSTLWYWFVDDINVDVPPTCLKPTDVDLDTATTTTATISWTDNNTEAPQGWTIEVNGTEVAASTNPFTLENLTPGTVYTVKVRANCTDDDMSAWSAEFLFATECEDVIVVTEANPYHEGFENYGVCWSVEQVAGSAHWNVYEGETYAYEGTHFAVAPYNEGAQSRLISPVLDLSQLTNPTLTFYHMQEAYEDDYGNITIDAMAVYYRASATDAWTLLADYTTEYETYTLETIELPTPSATYQISFLATGNDGNYVFLDDINITGAEETPCATPTNVTFANGVVTWTGNAANYNVHIVAGETTIDTTVNTTSYTVEGLNNGDHATVTVQAVCAEDDLSEWSTAVEFDYTNGINNYTIHANVYPNPTTGNVTIESNAINADITVFDVYGKLMMTSKVASERTELNFSTFAPGIYMVRIAETNSFITVKVVKK